MNIFNSLRCIVLWGGLLLLIGLAMGCNFDADRQYNLRFPATLIIVNDTSGQLSIKQIWSIPDAESTFVLKGSVIEPGKSLQFRIAESDYRVILAGDFKLIGACGDKAPRELPGDKLPRQGVSNSERWNVTVSLPNCEP